MKTPTTRRKPKPKPRTAARGQILDAANRHIAHQGLSGRTLSARHLNRAVFICRQHQLVPGKVLVAAGFNATRR